MSYYKVFNDTTKVQMLCNFDTAERAIAVFNAMVNKRPRRTKALEMRPTVEYVCIATGSYILYGDGARLNEIIKTLNNSAIKLETARKALSEAKLEIKNYEKMYTNSVARVDELTEETKLLNTANDNLLQSVREKETKIKKLEEKVAKLTSAKVEEATAKTVKKSVKKG